MLIAMAFTAGSLSMLVGVLIGWAISVKNSEDENGVLLYNPSYKETKR